jgi:predicted small secreted protein
MFRSRLLAALLLPCALLTTGCATLAFVNRDIPEELLKKPSRPELAPVDASDNQKAEERIRFGVGYLALERKFDDLVCWVRQKPPPC